MPAISTVKYPVRVSDDPLYLTVCQVRERFGVSDVRTDRHLRKHGFPRPIRLGAPRSKLPCGARDAPRELGAAA
jgi:hypothetical protein